MSPAKTPPPKDVEAYLKTVPPGSVAALQALRRIIRAAAPQAEEVISYGVPTYRHHGQLVSFSATPKHCAFYVMSPGPIAAHNAELKDYDTAPSAIRFQPDRPPPEDLIRTLVHERIRENEAKR
jgi:uncharacterized protein YdhG (YjbR/CyaY superfamily)